MGRLATIKTLAGFDFTFQPSLDKDRIFTLAQLGFIARCEAVHFLGPREPVKTIQPPLLSLNAVINRQGAFDTISLISATKTHGRGGRSLHRRAKLRSPKPLLVPSLQ